MADGSTEQGRAGRAGRGYRSFGIPVGSAAGILFGGLIAARIDWRMAFYVCGIAGLVLAPLMAFTVREPVRGRFDPPGAKTAAPPLGEVLRTLAGKASFWLIAFGASSSSALGYGLAFWMPQFLGRSFKMSLSTLSIYYSAMALFGGLFGIWMGGYLGDRLGRTSKAAYALVPALAFVLSIPFYAVGMPVSQSGPGTSAQSIHQPGGRDSRACKVGRRSSTAIGFSWTGSADVSRRRSRRSICAKTMSTSEA